MGHQPSCHSLIFLITLAVVCLASNSSASAKPHGLFSNNMDLQREACTPGGRQADFFVATDGSDDWSGRLPAPNEAHTDGPFATIDRARLAVRQSTPHKGPTVVYVRGGVYYLQNTLAFGPEDSGTEESPVIYAAYPGEKPVISAGRRLTGWKVDSRGWWHLSIPEIKSGDWNFITLYVNGERRYRPRLPEKGCYLIAGDLPLGPDEKPSGFEFAGKNIRGDWANLADVEVLTVHLWNMSRMRIKSVDANADTVHFTGGTFMNASFAQFNGGQPYFVENVKEALGHPGEWYLDRPTGELTYIPKKGESPKYAEVVAPRFDEILRMDGDLASHRYVSNIIFKGLTFAHANWCTPPQGHHFPQSDAVLGSAIVANGARHCRFERCDIRHTSAYAVQFGDGCKFNAVENCELTDLGAGGIKIGFWATKEPEENATSHNVIRNNMIAHGGRLLPAGTGVMVGASHHNRIENNDIFDLYYSGISLGYTWDDSICAHHNLVQGNHIWGIGQGVLSDMGAIYTLGRSPGTIIRHNLIHDVRSQFYGGWGIYLDALSSEILIEDNIVYRTDEGALHHNRGQDNRVVNNIFALGSETQLARSGYENGPSFDIERNIIYWNGSILLGRNWGDNHFRFDHNLYWDASRKPVMFGGLSLDQWRKQGQDEHSVIADPGFADPNAGDFTLRADSPAFKLGFKPISTSGFGRQNGKRSDGKFAPRAFPDIAMPAPLRCDFEDVQVGRRPPFTVIEEENSTAVVRVTDEAAASGSHSLKFTNDGKQKYPWHPFSTYAFKYTAGTIRVCFAVNMRAGGHLVHEWRDHTAPGKPGPSIVIDPSGKLSANGKFLQNVPLDHWVWLEIDCKVGAGATRDYSVKVKVQGEKKSKTYEGLAHDPEFHRLMALFFISGGKEPGAFFVDDISVSADN